MAVAKKEERPRGRPVYEENDYDRGRVDALCAVGFPHRQMSLYMHHDIKTLKKHYPEAFASSTREDKTLMVENALWYNAVFKMSFMAQISWLRAHKPDVYGDKPSANNGENELFLQKMARLLNDAV